MTLVSKHQPLSAVTAVGFGADGAEITPVTSDNPLPVEGSLSIAGGGVAHDSPDSGNPVKIGGYASSTAPTDVTAGDRVNAWFNLDGSQNVVARGNVASGATDSGNPIKVGGVYRATLPTLTDGQRSDLQVGADGGLRIRIGGVQSPADANANGGFGIKFTADNGTSSGAAWTIPFLFNGTTWDRQRGDTNGTVIQVGVSSTFWNYTSGTSPILSNTTTAVTIKAAAGASVRNYIDSIQLTTTAFTTGVPLAIRDGASGTILWAVDVPAAGFLNPVTINFFPPLKGTANTLLEIVTTTANTTGTVTANVQGHTGA